MKQIYLFSFLMLMAGISAEAQKRHRGPSLGVGIQVAQPYGTFKEKYDGVPAGVAGTFTGPLSNSPFEVGLGFAWNNMGADDEDVSVLMGQDAAGDDIYEMGTMRIRSNNYRYQAVARFRPFAGDIQVYGDLTAGVERFTTFTDIEVNSSGYTEVIEYRNQHHDFGWTVGWAAGARVRVGNGFFIDARFEKLQGGVAKYVDQESIVVDSENATISFETLETRTDKFTYQLGLAIEF